MTERADRTDWADYDIEDLVLAGRKVRKVIAKTARERPYALLGAAVGLGFILGGGLKSKTGRALLMASARYALPQLEQAALAVVRSMSAPEDSVTGHAQPVMGED